MTSFDFNISGNDIESGGEFIPTRDGETDVFVIDTIITDQEIDVFWEKDIDGDGTYEISVKLDRVDPGITSGNFIPANEYQDNRVRIVNVGAGIADIVTVGNLK